MKKKAGMLVFAVLLLSAFCISPVLAVPKDGQVPNGQAGKSPNGKLYLFEKNPETWAVISDGAWGKMKYSLWGEAFKFNFNGHRLEPGISYTLIYYPDPWPGNGLACLGTAIADEYGNVHIKYTLEGLCDLPADYDQNYGYGAKIWLVLTDDVDETTGQMIGWNPSEYLFEYTLINFDDLTCDYVADDEPTAEEPEPLATE
ncbi:MAG: hypothetical protein JXO49_06575 [Deltaproteobacteria bacterium]|nr:hypothetical protein [Candidatus Anaeroferrophillus wilburensis]MBN2888992.1 hypothetical protein [Deltaproteobacteria bacterium]